MSALDKRLSQARSESVRGVQASQVVKQTVKRNLVKAERSFSTSLVNAELAQYYDEVQERLKAAQRRVEFEDQLDLDEAHDAEVEFENYLHDIESRRAQRRQILRELQECNLG